MKTNVLLLSIIALISIITGNYMQAEKTDNIVITITVPGKSSATNSSSMATANTSLSSNRDPSKGGAWLINR